MNWKYFIVLLLVIAGLMFAAGWYVKPEKYSPGEVIIDTMYFYKPAPLPIVMYKRAAPVFIYDTIPFRYDSLIYRDRWHDTTIFSQRDSIVVDSAAIRYWRSVADSLIKHPDTLSRIIAPHSWVYADSIQTAYHMYYPVSEMHYDSILYLPQKERTIIRDSIVYRDNPSTEVSFWKRLQYWGEAIVVGVVIGIGIAK